MVRRNKNLIGQRFGRWTVLGDYNNKTRKWLCKCECGEKRMVSKYNLLNNQTLSCGCYNKDFPSSKKHGMRGHKFYNIWVNMKQRCFNHHNPSYKYYGERGIIVDKMWLSFENFRDDLYKSYLKHIKKFGVQNTSLDRIDNNGNYCKENCRWATQSEQSRNTSTNRIIIYKNQEYNIYDLAKKLNIKYSTLYNQIFRYNYKEFIIKK